jgi:hypothetical protein
VTKGLVRAAGGVVLREHHGNFEVLVTHRPLLSEALEVSKP